MPTCARRHFLRGSLAVAGLVLVSGCGSSSPQAQRSAVRRLGFLFPGPRESQRSTIDGLRGALAEFGYVEGQTVAIDYRFGDTEAQLPELATELVRLNVELIVTNGTPAGLAAKQATETIPVVILSSDPVGAGLVPSLARPGGNVTGVTNYVPEITGKQLQLLLEVLPAASRIAYLVNSDNPTSVPQEGALLDAAKALTIQLIRLDTRTVAQIESRFQDATAQRVEGLVVLSDSLVISPQRALTAELTVRAALPAIFADRRPVEYGGLMGYSPNLADEFRSRASYVDRILRGARPADLPVEGPRKFDFVVNLKAAQALGLTIPSSVLQQATEVIQ